MKTSIDTSSCASSASSLISKTGRLVCVRLDSVSKRFLSIVTAPKVSASMSSVATACTSPDLFSSAQVASASEGASITGQPSRRSSSWQSAFICGVARAVRCAAFRISSGLPLASAVASSLSASSFFSLRPASVCNLSSGGLPSKT